MNNTPSCQNLEILESIESSLDRVSEASWFIKLMEENYHYADQFRWSLNSFLKSLKEILQLLTMDLQQNKEVSLWLKQQKNSLATNKLINTLFKHRDFIVHQSMLVPASKGTVGFTRGRGLKMGLTTPIRPLEDSRVAIVRYIKFAAEHSDFLGILQMDDDSGEYTCVQREWCLDAFPNQELTQLALNAWQLVANLVY